MQSCHLACHDQSRRSATKKGLKRRIGGSEEGGAKDYSHVVKPAGSSRLRLAIFSLLDTLTGESATFLHVARGRARITVIMAKRLRPLAPLRGSLISSSLLGVAVIALARRLPETLRVDGVSKGAIRSR